MSRLTSQERHRIFLARHETMGGLLTRLSAAPAALPEPRARRHRLRPLLETVMIVTLLGGGWFAYHAVAFHRPASIVDALLPRL